MYVGGRNIVWSSLEVDALKIEHPFIVGDRAATLHHDARDIKSSVLQLPGNQRCRCRPQAGSVHIDPSCVDTRVFQ